MAKFDYPYKKGVNITAWVLQFLVCIILLGASAWLLWLAGENDYELGGYSGLFVAAAGLQIAITGLNIVFNIVEIVLIAKKRMPPALYLTSACIKTTIWAIIFILNLVSLSVISIILTLVLLATSLLQLIYGAILVHRKRKGTLTGGSYVPAHNPAHNPEGHAEAAYAAPQPGYYYPPPDASTEYKPPTGVASPPPQYGFPPQDHYAPQAAPGSYELDSRARNF